MSVVKERVTIKDLQKMGYPVTPGNEYIPKGWIRKKAPSIRQVRKYLSKIKGTLAEVIAEMREEE